MVTAKKRLPKSCSTCANFAVIGNITQLISEGNMKYTAYGRCGKHCVNYTANSAACASYRKRVALVKGKK